MRRCLILLALLPALLNCQSKTPDEISIFSVALKYELRIMKSPIYPTVIVVQDLRAAPSGRLPDPPDVLIAELRNSGFQVFKRSEIRGDQRKQEVAECIAQLTELTDDGKAEVTFHHVHLLLDHPELPIMGGAGATINLEKKQGKWTVMGGGSRWVS